jgi:hypothetical protein
MSMTRDEATKTAAARLEAIEAWARRTFIAATACALMIGSGMAFAGYKYWQVTTAISAARDAFAQGVNEWNSEMEAKFRERPAAIHGRPARPTGYPF